MTKEISKLKNEEEIKYLMMRKVDLILINTISTNLTFRSWEMKY